MIKFFVPMGVTEMIIEVSLRKWESVSYFLYDPLKRLRMGGYSYSKDLKIFVRETDLRKVNFGTWRLEVVSRETGETPLFDLKVEFSRSKVRPQWYRGELHTHTKASDGKWSIEELTLVLKERGVDFFFVTDHNVLGTSKPIEVKGLQVYPGIEITVAKGHTVVLDPDEKLRPFKFDGYICGIAHPFFPRNESCPDCSFESSWKCDFVEVWNSDIENERWFIYNVEALKKYKRVVKRRYLTAVATGDVHNEASLVHWIPSHFLLPDLSLESVLNSLVEGLVVCGEVKIDEDRLVLPEAARAFLEGTELSTNTLENFHETRELEVKRPDGKLLVYYNFKAPLNQYL
uniref:Polymerase/histidinol phosphatase N-terminal domain-containing protein n=1 Tax=Pseudothermotoga hypogea TaxID=57487 RepID=A0A832I6T4_9THEM